MGEPTGWSIGAARHSGGPARRRLFDPIWLAVASVGFALWVVTDCLDAVAAARRDREEALGAARAAFTAVREGHLSTVDLVSIRGSELFSSLAISTRDDEFGTSLVLVPAGKGVQR